MPAELWIDAVDRYLDELNVALQQLRESLDPIGATSRQGDFDQLPELSETMARALAEVEARLQQRQELLTAAPVASLIALEAPTATAPPRSLEQALRARGDTVRGERIAAIRQEVEELRQQVLGLFVFQYHLAETSGQVLHLLASGTNGPATYRSGGTPQRSAAPPGGGLLDAAG
jgi:hypothetical protein